MTPPPRAVLFDLYDTLAWSDWPSHASFIAEQLGVDVSDVVAAYDRLRERRDGGYFTDPVSVLLEVMEFCGVEADSADAEHLARMEADLLAGHVTLYEDSIPALRELRRHGVLTAVVSNCSPSTRPVVERLGLEDETDAVVLSYEVGMSKPQPGIFAATLERLGTTADVAVFVDDRSDYLDGAANLGMGTFRIERSHAFGEEVAGGPHPVVGDLRELLERIGL